MLKTLTVWNFALIEYAQIDFNEGLNILTGETGAGKSILIDSVGVILGYRASSAHIRNGCDWLRVEAVYDLTGRGEIQSFLNAQGIIEDDERLTISRQITRSGKNQIRVNGCHVTLRQLKSLGERLVDIHGQHENQSLLKSDSQFALVDTYDGKMRQMLDEYRRIYQEWRDLQADLKRKEEDSREYARRVDMLKWQSEEIAAANLKEHEDEALESEIKVLANAEKISQLIGRSHALLVDGDKGYRAIIPSLAEVKRSLESVIRYDDRLVNALALVSQSLCQLEECSFEVRGYGESMEYSPERLNALQERMDVIYKLRKKYGATIEDVLLHYKKVKDELNQIENYDQIMEELKKRQDVLRRTLIEKAARITKLRLAASERLSAEIQRHLHSLGMPNAKLQIAISPLAKMNANGADEIAMLFSANLGEALKPIQKVASGGELSRITLAIKAVSASRDDVGVMIFDEIDTGIGGKTAQMVAERIAMVASHKQVLCITHLPQIACMADVHLYIDKKAQDGKTVTEIRRLDGSEQERELARMASGMDITEASLDNAREMLDNAKIKKEKWKNKA